MEDFKYLCTYYDLKNISHDRESFYLNKCVLFEKQLHPKWVKVGLLENMYYNFLPDEDKRKYQI